MIYTEGGGLNPLSTSLINTESEWTNENMPPPRGMTKCLLGNVTNSDYWSWCSDASSDYNDNTEIPIIIIMMVMIATKQWLPGRHIF